MLRVGWIHRVGHQSACSAQALNYELAEGVSIDDLAEEDRFYLGDGYKRTVLEHMSTSQLLDMLLIHPTVSVSPSYRDTGLTASYTFKPLSNLVHPPASFQNCPDAHRLCSDSAASQRRSCCCLSWQSADRACSAHCQGGASYVCRRQ